MPKHTSWFTYLFDLFPALKSNAQNLGSGMMHALGLSPAATPGYKSMEPLLTSMIYMLAFLLLASMVRGKIKNARAAAIPSETLTLTTLFEVFFGFFYDLTAQVMGAEKARKHFPLIGASAAFIILSNFMGLVPGFGSPTSSWSVTMGCALIVFAVFNYWGLKVNGAQYIIHMGGPKWYLFPLVFAIEVVSTLLRAFTLSIRLMINIAADHLLASIFLGLVALLVPIPVALLGIIVCLVQTIVFCLLTAVYISLATEDLHAHH